MKHHITLFNLILAMSLVFLNSFTPSQLSAFDDIPTPTPTLASGDVTVYGVVYLAGSSQVISGANVSVSVCLPHNPFSAVSDQFGQYSILVPGMYLLNCNQVTLSAFHSGFQNYSQNILVTDLYSQPQRSIPLTPGGITPTGTSTVTVTPSATFTPSNTPLPLRADTIGIYKNGTFYLRNTNNTGVADITATFGGDPSDLPVVGDWNGDLVDTIGVYRGSTGMFFLSDSNVAPSVAYSPVFGNPGDAPFAGHWTADTNGSGIGVYRNSNGILYQKKTLTTGFADYFAIFGNPGDQGFAGDWDGDGFDSIGIYRGDNQTWYLSNSNTPSGITFGDISFVWYASGIPVVGDWDGNGTSTVGHGDAVTGLVTLNNTNAAPTTLNIFPYGPTGGKPIAGKWVAAGRPAQVGHIIDGSSGGLTNDSDNNPVD